MKLARRIPTVSPFDLLRTNFDRLFTNALDPFETNGLTTQPFPALNVWMDGETVMAEAELPGIKLEDIEVFVVGDELTIKGRRTIEHTEKATVHRQERISGEFTRVVTLPVEVDAAKVEATLRDGILTVKMPKTEETRARKITVKGA